MSARENRYDVVVVGGGHAGIEAAAAAARIGARTALVTMRIDRIGEMSCNPAIGGLAKGQLAREVDALGGLMGRVSDTAGIQFRMLNASKGPAVRAPRAQMDKVLYRQHMQRILASLPRLTIVEAEVKKVLFKGDSAVGVVTEKGDFFARSVVITGGTFLNGLIHCGERKEKAGRMGEGASEGLSDFLMGRGMEMVRLKTGTPPRLHRDSIDYSRFEQQPGDSHPIPFSYMSGDLQVEQVSCWVGYTNTETHAIIEDNIDRSPLYSGHILGIGPRYCPSIEDKVVRFPDKDRHQIFIEPEVRGGESMYINGISTSMPEEVQKAFVRSIDGLHRAEFLRPGYAVEYDAIQPTQLKSTLESRNFPGLFCCGQINGTSGYEEAAGQGVVAGANAALRSLGREQMIVSRESAYIGVMIDDLVTQGADEPYRMFTSRAENRLELRSDNADQRLTPLARDYGLIDDERWRALEEKMESLSDARAALKGLLVTTRRQAEEIGLNLRGGFKSASTAEEMVRRPEISAGDFSSVLPAVALLGHEASISLETDIKYAGYIERNRKQRQKIARQAEMRIPDSLDYHAVAGLSNEMRERLIRVRPETLGQAGRVPGLTPAAVTALAIGIASQSKRKQ